MKTERKKRDKKHLKGRILRSISLILICSMILSTLIGYLYFNQVVRKQRLEEEKKPSDAGWQPDCISGRG